MARFLAPKLKAEYVDAIMTRSNANKDMLMEMNTDRLKRKCGNRSSHRGE